MEPQDSYRTTILESFHNLRKSFQRRSKHNYQLSPLFCSPPRRGRCKRGIFRFFWLRISRAVLSRVAFNFYLLPSVLALSVPSNLSLTPCQRLKVGSQP